MEEDIVCEDSGNLKEILLEMFEVIHRVAKFSCYYVKRGRVGRQPCFCTWQMLMIAERTVEGLIFSRDKEMVEKMNGELSKVIEDFKRAVDVEALRLAKKTGEHSLSQSDDGSFSVVSCRAKAFAQAA